MTGGAGFIGSALVRYLLTYTSYEVVNVDKLTYAGDLSTLTSVEEKSNYRFEQADITNTETVREIIEKYRPQAVMHLAAESHVDRSIAGPSAFVETNVVGTYTLLEVAREYWEGLPSQKRSSFRFLHVSTDEVFGELEESGYFSEETPYDPSSPYSASKASSDHFVRAWHRTYGLPVLVTNCSNNYGPYQYPEKLIPIVIQNALEEKSIPVYGDGTNIRDWLYVEDHVRALLLVLTNGSVGETYTIGGHNEKQNIDVVTAICDLMDELVENPTIEKHSDLIEFVTDRPGHDFRYAIDATKIERELGWSPKESFETGLAKTVKWYLSHQEWCDFVSGDIQNNRQRK